MLDAALAYAARGWAVFPLVERDKVPKVAGGFKVATTDEEQIRAMWERFPDCNIGIATGSMSGGLVVVDLDIDDERGKDGNAVLRAWEREHGELPETVCAVTGGGGEHIVFKASEPVRCAVGEGEFEGVDVRADGGYIVAPPSVHPNGRRYEWEVAPDDMPVARADGNVLALAEAVRLSQTGGRDGGRAKKVDVNKKVEKGGRNNALFKVLCAGRSAGMDDTAIEALAETYNSMSLIPPLPEDEVRRTIESVIRFPPGNKDFSEAEESGQSKRSPGRPRKFNHAEIAKALIRDHNMCFIDGAPAISTGKAYAMGWDAVESAIIDMADDCTQTNRREVIAYLNIRAPRVEQADPHLIAFSNGVLDVRTMQLMEHEPWMVIPNVIPHRWNPFAECPDVDRTLMRLACGDPGMELNLSEVMGHCMFRKNAFRAFPILLGSGSNGKSTYISMLGAMLGSENVSALDMAFIGERFQAVGLVGKLANLGDDIANEIIPGKVLSVVKKVATGNKINTDVKGTKGFDFTPYCTMVFSANEFPRLGDSSDGMMSRFFPMRFNARFSPSDPDFDPHISEKLATEEACERMCRLGVEGLHRLLERNTFTPNAESVRERAEIRVDNNTVLQWIEDEGLEPEYAVGEKSASIYGEYARWCRDNGVHEVSSNKFAKELRHTWHVVSVPNGHETVKGKRVTKRVFQYER